MGWLIVVGAALTGCRPADQTNAAGGNMADEPVVNLPAIARPAEPMNREALLMAVARAASARAAGTDDGASQRELDGQPFEFTIRFGCSGPVEELRTAPLGWTHDPAKATLRLRAMPTITTDDPVAARIAGKAVEAIEGFWVPAPWLLQATCPAAAAPPVAPPEPAAASDQESGRQVQPSLRWPKVGIAQFFTSADDRTRRRDSRAYEAVESVEDGAPVGSQGFDLVLSGRLRLTPGNRVIECVAAGSDTPPDCIVSADIDEVRMQRPEDGSVVARWSS